MPVYKEVLDNIRCPNVRDWYLLNEANQQLIKLGQTPIPLKEPNWCRCKECVV